MTASQRAIDSPGVAPQTHRSADLVFEGISAAFFDVDETLIVVKSMFAFLRFYLRERGESPSVYDRFASQLSEAAADGVPRDEINRCYYRFYTGESAAKLAASGRRWFEQALTQDLWVAETEAAYRRHQEHGAKTGLVSGSFFACLDPIADHLGATWVNATQPLIRRGELTGEVDFPMIGAQKAAALDQRARRHDLDLTRCAAYGDHPSDLPMLEHVGFPVVVGHNPTLVDTAAVNGWPCLTPRGDSCSSSRRDDAARVRSISPLHAAHHEERLDHNPGGIPMCPGLLGVGSYQPDRIIDNEEMARRVPSATAAWIGERTGIYERRYAAEDQATSDLAVLAAEAALEDADLCAEDVNWLIVSTSTPDSPQPPTSYRVQAGLGAWNAAAFDVNVVCSGFIYALGLASSLVQTNPGTRALVIAAEVYSRCLDFEDRRTSVLLGDGAGAAVVGEVENGGFLNFELKSRGDLSHMIGVEAGGSRRPACQESVADGGHLFRMEGRRVRDFVMEHIPAEIDNVVLGAGEQLREVRHVVPHQPNAVLLRDLETKLGTDRAEVHRTVEHLGNVGSASVPVTLDAAYRANKLQLNDLLVLSSFGGGMAMGHCSLRWSKPTPQHRIPRSSQGALASPIGV